MEGNFEHLDDCFEYVFKGPHDGTQFRLFDLPPELWLKVCEFAVLRPATMDITRAKRAKHQQHLVKQPAITKTCRVLRQEALPMFYQRNKFEVFHWGGVACVRKWMAAIGLQNLVLMKTLPFHAKFEAQFWKEKFCEMGIPVKIDLAPDQSRAVGRLQSFIVTFLPCHEADAEFCREAGPDAISERRHITL